MLISFHKHLYYIFNIPNLKIKSQTDFTVRKYLYYMLPSSI